MPRGLEEETMSHTFSQLLFHFVFSTRYREGVIDPDLRAELYPYVEGIVRSEGGVLLGIGGMPDHVHLLIRLRPAIFMPDLLRSIKAGSSRWINERSFLPRSFAWQEGYGAFSVSESSARTVHRYIQTQERHHRQRSFEEEWISLLDRHGIEFDPAHPFG
jgi:REP element-mobilizing transposase RayT